ncbi:MAG: serine/threonine-protein kinase [Myxococcota bacterium]|nr:serine/threonine-protein kinase [Myxococcota bacterium]
MSRQRIGEYPIIRVIARGGAAEVFEVACPTTHRHLALKRLNISGSAIQRFKREFQILKTLRHPSIVRVFEQGITDDGRCFITMELLRGKVSHTWIRGIGSPGSPRRTSEAARVISATAEALTALHAQGIIHRDIKASNILILSDASVRLLDFGSAIAEGVCGGITNPGEFVGTFAYAAPEQILGEPVSGRIDVYALGVMFYRLTTGKMPFSADDRYRLAQQHLRDRPRSPREVRPEIPASLSDLIMTMLRKEPSARPTASEVHTRLVHGELEAVQVDSESIRQRLSSLRPVARRLMQALAVAGEPVDYETLGHMTDISLDEARHFLQSLESDAWVHRAKNHWFIGDRCVGEQLVRGLREARRYLLQTRLHEFRRLITDTVC